MHDVLPDELIDEIKEYLRERSALAAPRAWKRANADEDTVSGDFLGQLSNEEYYPNELSKEDNQTQVPALLQEDSPREPKSLTGRFLEQLRRPEAEIRLGNRRFRWSVSYTKIRGRGRGADEKKIGADGIFEIEIEDYATGLIHRKGLLFQAKKKWRTKDKKLIDQVSKMEKHV